MFFEYIYYFLWCDSLKSTERLLWTNHNATFLTFTGPCIANIFAENNQRFAKFHNLFISVRRSTCFRQLFSPSSGAQNCTYSVRWQYWPDKYLTLYVQFWAPYDGRNTSLRHVQCLTEINKLVKHGITLIIICEYTTQIYKNRRIFK